MKSKAYYFNINNVFIIVYIWLCLYKCFEYVMCIIYVIIFHLHELTNESNKIKLIQLCLSEINTVSYIKICFERSFKEFRRRLLVIYAQQRNFIHTFMCKILHLFRYSYFIVYNTAIKIQKELWPWISCAF